MDWPSVVKVADVALSTALGIIGRSPQLEWIRAHMIPQIDAGAFLYSSLPEVTGDFVTISDQNH
jgi:hypothetical protein